MLMLLITMINNFLRRLNKKEFTNNSKRRDMIHLNKENTIMMIAKNKSKSKKYYINKKK